MRNIISFISIKISRPAVFRRRAAVGSRRDFRYLCQASSTHSAIRRETASDWDFTRKIKHRCFLMLSFLYLGFTVAVTCYSVNNYPKSLPAVTVTAFRMMNMEGKKFDTAVPKESLHPDGGEMMYLLYSIQQKEGPWGYRYYVAQNSVMCKEEWYGNAKLEYVPVVCLNKVDGPVIVDSERELYSGEEVRLVR